MMTKIKLWFMETKLYVWLLKRVIPFIRLTTYYTSMRGRIYHKVYDIIKPGDIILTVDKRKLTTFLIPGDWTHAAICISKDKNFEVAEMTHNDYTKSTVADLCFEADRVVVLRCSKFTKAYTRKFIKNTLALEDVPYDYKFELGIKSLSCAELVWAADPENRIGACLEDVAGLGRDYISPQGIYNADNVTVVLDTSNIN